jgi:hypothetical protein
MPQGAHPAAWLGYLWVDDFTYWGGMYVLNSHTGTSRAHPARFGE